MARKKSKSGKNGKNKSLYGPIKSKNGKQSPRKASSHHYKRHPHAPNLHFNHMNHHHNHRKPNFKRHQSRETRIPVHQVKFSLRLPPRNASFEYTQVPWWTSNSSRNTTASKSFSSSCIPILKHVSNENLKRLDEELLAFSQYVKLTPEEYEARQRVIQHVSDICQGLFGSNHKKKRKHDSNNNNNNNTVSIQAFGSFATPQVCTFQSDVDLILWGVVPVATHTIFTTKDEDNEHKRSASVDSDASSIKVDRVQRWKEALAELDAQERSDDEIVQQQQQQQRETAIACPSGDVKDATIDSAMNVLNPDATAGGAAVNGCQKSEVQQEQEAAGDTLFVIDRVGDAVKQEKSETNNAEVSAMSETTAIIRQDCQVEESFTDEPSHARNAVESQSASRRQEQEAEANALDQPLAAAEATLDGNDNDGSESELPLQESDSDADSADKLESYRENRASIHHTDDDSSDSDDQYEAPISAPADEEHDDFEVSLVSHRKPASATHSPASTGPTGETRKSVVKALKSLGKAFWKSSVIHTVEVRRHAKVPIIATGTHLGFEFDVGVGGHNGTDTSHYASTQAQRFESFAPVVMLLKVLLGQQALDKPFTGGLGSYKLYVLVAHHLEQHLAMGGADRPSEVLATFFFRFRKFCNTRSSQRPADTPLETTLSLHRKVECDGGCADFQAIFKLEHCSNLFDQSYSRLLEELEAPNYSTDSFLATIVHPGPLQRERDRNRNRAKAAGRYIQLKDSCTNIWTEAKQHKQQFQLNLNDPGGLQQKWHEQRRGQSQSGLQSQQYKNDQAQIRNGSPRPAGRKCGFSNGDANADQLMAGYGMKRGPRGGLIPRTRPDVEARRLSTLPETVGRATKNRKNKKKQKRDEGLKEIALEEVAKGGGGSHRPSRPERRRR